jgi:hypothetical protein
VAGDHQADDRVGVEVQQRARLVRADRRGGDHVRGPARAEREDRGAHRRAGRETVVDDHDGAVDDRAHRPVAPVAPLAALELFGLGGDDGVDRVRVDVGRRDDVLVEHARAAGRDRAEGQLRVAGHAELADDQHVEGRGQRRGDLDGDGHTAAWQGQDEGECRRGRRDEGTRDLRRQPAPRVGSIDEETHLAWTCPVARRRKRSSARGGGAGGGADTVRGS